MGDPQREMTNVVGAVIESKGRILIAQRTGDRHEGQWEFPGGKVEPGEDPRKALAREILEELGVRVAVGEAVATVPFQVGRRNYQLTAYRATIQSSQLDLRDHKRIEWVAPEELLTFPLLPPDVPIAEQVREAARRKSALP